jgi:hypothetical protein
VELKLAELRKSEELLRLRLAELEQLEERNSRNTSVEEEGVREQAEGRVATDELFETDQQNVTDEDRNLTDDEDRKTENRKQEDRKEEQVGEKDADGDSETALKNQVD